MGTFRAVVSGNMGFKDAYWRLIQIKPSTSTNTTQDLGPQFHTGQKGLPRTQARKTHWSLYFSVLLEIKVRVMAVDSFGSLAKQAGILEFNSLSKYDYPENRTK